VSTADQLTSNDEKSTAEEGGASSTKFEDADYGKLRSCPALEYKYAALLSDENMVILLKWLIFGYQEIVTKKSILAG
jgi:hypothetical protein